MTAKIPSGLWARVDAVRGRLSRRQWLELTVEQDEARGRALDHPHHGWAYATSPAAKANALRAAKAKADTETAGADLVAFLSSGVDVWRWQKCPRSEGVPDRAYVRAWGMLVDERAVIQDAGGFWHLADAEGRI